MNLEKEFNSYCVYLKALEELEMLTGCPKSGAVKRSAEDIILQLSKQFMDTSIALHNAIVQNIELEAENKRLRSKFRDLESL
jgi:Holliday junction resolvasome RuvABC DNA-binding subunit